LQSGFRLTRERKLVQSVDIVTAKVNAADSFIVRIF
jgi:hypothetical protein